MRRCTALIGGAAVATIAIAAAHGAALAQGGSHGAAAVAAATHGHGHGAARATQRFMALLDPDGDGRVAIAEIAAEQGRLLTVVDVDGDGKLSVDEFRRRGRLLQSIGATTLFDMLDTNGDAQLSAAELNAPSQRWVARYDVDGDAALNADEVRATRQGRFGHDRSDHDESDD